MVGRSHTSTVSSGSGTSCRYLNYFRFRWWKSNTSAFPWCWGRRLSFPSCRDRTRLTGCLLFILSDMPEREGGGAGKGKRGRGRGRATGSLEDLLQVVHNHARSAHRQMSGVPAGNNTHCQQHNSTSWITLGSVNRLRRSTTTVRTKFGERAFSYAGPVAWNSLPVHVREEMEFLSF